MLVRQFELTEHQECPDTETPAAEGPPTPIVVERRPRLAVAPQDLEDRRPDPAAIPHLSLSPLPLAGLAVPSSTVMEATRNGNVAP